ncbi:MAG: tetratricopeptide repeat protein, partial [Phycisphaerae bacterium]
LTLAAAEHYEQAVQALADAARLRPLDAQVALELSLALKAVGTDGASPSVAAAAPSDPTGSQGTPAARLRLARTFANEPELLDTFLSLPRTSRDDDLFRILADAVASAISKHPTYADLHHHLARISARLGRLRAAIDSDDRALAINPNYVRAMIHRADLYVALNQGDRAVVELERAVDAGANYADVHFKLGELHDHAGRIDRAREAYRQALRLNQKYGAARNALKRLSAA